LTDPRAARFERDCMILIGDRTHSDHAQELFGKTLTLVGDLGQKYGLSPRYANDEIDLGRKIKSAVTNGCNDVVIFLTGHGLPPKGLGKSADPAVSLGPGKGVVIASDLTKIMAANRKAKFKIMIFSCFSGRFVEALQHTPNLSVLATSSNAGELSWGYIRSGPRGGPKATGPAIRNPNQNPAGTPDWVNAMVRQIEKRANSSTTDELGTIIGQAAGTVEEDDFAAQLGWTHPQSFVGDRPPVINSFAAFFGPPETCSTCTIYTVRATDPEGGNLDYSWSKVPPPGGNPADTNCGTFTTNSPQPYQAVWNHPNEGPASCSHAAMEHPGHITVVVSDRLGAQTLYTDTHGSATFVHTGS
jgi:hypothetical protein